MEPDFVLPRRKRPAELFTIGVDFKGDLKTGDTIASHNATAKEVETGADVTATLLGARVLTGTLLEVLVKNGADATDYDVLFEATTTAGHKFQHDYRVPVRA